MPRRAGAASRASEAATDNESLHQLPPQGLVVQRAAFDLGTAAGQHACFIDHNGLGLIVTDSGCPFDVLDNTDRALQFGTVVQGGFLGVHGVDLR
jgi:hypothetical protein